MAAKKRLKREIVLIEGISTDDRGQELPILSEFFQMLKWDYDPCDVFGRGSPDRNKAAFLKALLENRSRFIHVSAHGSGSDLTLSDTVRTKQTSDWTTSRPIVEGTKSPLRCPVGSSPFRRAATSRCPSR